MQLQLVLVLKRGIIDKSTIFYIGLIQFSFHSCVHLMHVKVFSIEVFQYFSQIVPKVFTLVVVLFIHLIMQMVAQLVVTQLSCQPLLMIPHQKQLVHQMVCVQTNPLIATTNLASFI